MTSRLSVIYPSFTHLFRYFQGHNFACTNFTLFLHPPAGSVVYEVLYITVYANGHATAGFQFYITLYHPWAWPVLKGLGLIGK